MNEIKNINIMEYLIRFDSFMPVIMKCFVRQGINSNQRRLLGAYIAGEPCGAAVVNDFEKDLDIIYIAVREDSRRKGVCRSLIEYCITYAKNTGKRKIRLQYTLTSEKNGYIDKFIQGLGFVKYHTAVITVVSLTERSKTEWLEITKSRRSVLMAKLSEKGFVSQNYIDSSPETIEVLHENLMNDFPYRLDPRDCTNEVMEKHSFITSYQGNPVSYCIASTADNGKSAIIEFLAAAYGYINKGAFFPALVSCVDSIINDSECNKIAWTVRSENKRMQQMMSRTLQFTDMTVKNQIEYQYQTDNMEDIVR